MLIEKFRLNLVAALALVTFLPWLTSCNEQPTDLGYSLIKDTVQITAESDVDGKYLISSESFVYNPATFNHGDVLVGKSGDIKAGFLTRFGYIPDSLAYLTADKIVSAKLLLAPKRYSFGDTAGSNFLSFRIQKVIKQWTVTTSAQTVFGDQSLFDPAVLAAYSGSIELKDTVPDLSFDFPKHILLEWFANMADTTSTKDTIWGIACMPDDNSTVIRRFSGAGYSAADVPRIQMIYYNSGNALDTLTLSASVNKSYVTVPEPSGKELVLQGGAEINPKLGFDVTSIPTLAGIHKAELVLTVDQEKCRKGNSANDSLMIAFFYKDFQDYIDGDDPTSYSYGYKAYGTDTYIFSDITVPITYWLRNHQRGVLVFNFDNSTAEYQTVDKIVMHGIDDPDVTKRPKLRIIYSLLKEKDDK